MKLYCLRKFINLLHVPTVAKAKLDHVGLRCTPGPDTMVDGAYKIANRLNVWIAPNGTKVAVVVEVRDECESWDVGYVEIVAAEFSNCMVEI